MTCLGEDNTGYVLENLQPQTAYDLRFASKNRVGFSLWGAGMQVTTPSRWVIVPRSQHFIGGPS
jgi:hypothetical protein